MRRIPTERLRPGDQLGRDVYARPDVAPLLRAGSTIADGFRDALLRAGIVSVWIDDEASRGIEPLEIVSEATRQRSIHSLRETFADVSQASAAGHSLSSETIDDLHTTASVIAADVESNAALALALNDLASFDGYTMQHSLEVAALGLAIGFRLMRQRGWIDHQGHRRFDHVDEKLIVLGVGLLLHDIGKLEVPAEMVHKNGPLNRDEWALMRTHPESGYRLLKGVDGIDAVSRAVVRSHHEQWNGSGYPDGRKGIGIHQFARVAAAADVFDAMTSQRSYKAPMPTHAAYAYVVARAGTHFDPEVVDIFRASVAPYPPGTGVILSDGSHGIVKDVRQGSVSRPVVRVISDASGGQVGPVEVDLASASDLAIVTSDEDLNQQF